MEVLVEHGGVAFHDLICFGLAWFDEMMRVKGRKQVIEVNQMKVNEVSSSNGCRDSRWSEVAND